MSHEKAAVSHHLHKFVQGTTVRGVSRVFKTDFLVVRVIWAVAVIVVVLPGGTCDMGPGGDLGGKFLVVRVIWALAVIRVVLSGGMCDPGGTSWWYV